MEEKLIDAVQKKYGVKILNRGDCEKLSEIILEQTNENVNYNTLRRIYGLAQKVKTRRDTLDILSRFIGYKSYYNYVNELPHEVSWESRLNLYELIDKNDTKNLLLFLENKAQSSEDMLLPLINLIREYLSARKINELNILFNSDLLKKNIITYNQKLIVGNSIGILLRSIQLNKHEITALSKTMFYRTTIFEIFVDYSSLNGYYSEFSHLLIKKRDYKNKLFIRCLLNLKAYLNNSKITSIHIKNSALINLHPVLRGRYYSNFLLGDKKSELQFFNIKSLVSSNDLFQSYYEPMVISIVTMNTEVKYWLITQVEKAFEQKIYSEPHYINTYQLMKTHYYAEIGETKKSKDIFEAINIDNFILCYKSFLLYFYYSLGYELYETTEMNELMKQSLKNNPYKRLKYNYKKN